MNALNLKSKGTNEEGEQDKIPLNLKCKSNNHNK